MREGSTGKTIGSVEKAVQILHALSLAETGLGVTELGKTLGCGVSATYHLLNTLKQSNFIEQDKKTKKYRIGFGLYTICAQARNQNILSNLAQPALDRLSAACDETGNLIVLDNFDAIYVAQSEGRSMLKMFTRLGARVPLYCTAGGKTILSFLPREDWERCAAQTRFDPFTEQTIRSGKQLLTELEHIRLAGYGMDNEEREKGISCIAAPVFDAGGTPLAAVSISGPTYRLLEKGLPRLIDHVREAAASISATLGYPADA